MTRSMRIVATLTTFKLVWLAIVFSAVWSLPLIGAIALCAFLFVEVVYCRRRNALLPVLLVGVIGFGFDNLLVFSNLLEFTQPSFLGAPLWMALLWMNLALILDTGLGWLKDNLVLAGLLGAISGPLAYAAGVGFGLIEISAPPGLSYGVIALAWLVALPSLLITTRFWGGGYPSRIAPIATRTAIDQTLER